MQSFIQINQGFRLTSKVGLVIITRAQMRIQIFPPILSIEQSLIQNSIVKTKTELNLLQCQNELQ